MAWYRLFAFLPSINTLGNLKSFLIYPKDSELQIKGLGDLKQCLQFSGDPLREPKKPHYPMGLGVLCPLKGVRALLPVPDIENLLSVVWSLV
jgi:hypothetical protein